MSITSRAMPSRSAGQPQLRPSRPCSAGDVVAHIGRAVHHDRALVGLIVEAGVQAAQAQRVAVAADVGVVGAKQAEARLVALGRLENAVAMFLPLPLPCATSSS